MNSTQPDKSARRRARLVRLALCAMSLVLSLALAEVATRAMEWVVPGFNRYYFKLVDHGEKYAYDPVLGWINAPGFRMNESGVEISINSRGLRGPERAYAKPDGVKRIVVLGDSYAFGYGVDDDETFPVFLEKILAEQGRPCEVVNMGVNAYGIDQSYLTLEREGLKYSPDLVVLVFFTENDLIDILSPALENAGKPYFLDLSLEPANVPVPLLPADNQKLRIVRPNALIGHSALYRLIFLRGVTSPSATSVLEFFRLCSTEKRLAPGFPGNPIDLAVGITDGIAQQCRESSCPLVVVKCGGFLNGFFKNAGQLFHARLVETVPGAHHLDLDAEFQKRQLSAKTLTEGNSYNHWNPDGNRRVAEILLEFVDQHALLDGGKK